MPIFLSEPFSAYSSPTTSDDESCSLPHRQVQNIRIRRRRTAASNKQATHSEPVFYPNSDPNSTMSSSANTNNTSDVNDTISMTSSLLLPGVPASTRPPSITIPYKSSPNPFHTLDLYLPAAGLAPDTPWFIFLHGGYWADATQSKEVGSIILTRLPNHWAGASIDYRLSPEVSYPGHLNDVKHAVKFLKTAYNIQSAVFMAHGAGACIAYQYIFSALCSHDAYWIRHIVSSGGVYDLMSLANDSPYYQKYIEDAFGKDRLNWYDLSPQNFEWDQIEPEYHKPGNGEEEQEQVSAPAPRAEPARRPLAFNGPPNSTAYLQRRSALAEVIEEMRRGLPANNPGSTGFTSRSTSTHTNAFSQSRSQPTGLNSPPAPIAPHRVERRSALADAIDEIRNGPVTGSAPRGANVHVQRSSALADAIEEMRRGSSSNSSNTNMPVQEESRSSLAEAIEEARNSTYPSNSNTSNSNINTTSSTTNPPTYNPKPAKKLNQDNIRMEATLIHSKFDKIVPIQQALKFDDKLEAAGFNVSLRLLSIDGHDNVLETAELVTIALEICDRLDQSEQETIYQRL